MSASTPTPRIPTQASLRSSDGRRPWFSLPNRRLRAILSLDDFEVAARRHLPRSIFAFVHGGAEAEATLRDNRSMFEDYHLVPRAARRGRPRTPRASLLGTTYSAPFGVAPMGMDVPSAPWATSSLPRHARRLNFLSFSRALRLIRMEDVIAVCPAAWFQAYLPLDFFCHGGAHCPGGESRLSHPRHYGGHDCRE